MAPRRIHHLGLAVADLDEAVRLLDKHRPALDRVAHALLEKETLDRGELDSLLADVEAESRSAELVGTPRVVPLPSGD